MIFFAFLYPLPGQETDSLKTLRREQRLQRRLELKESHQRTIIRGSFLYARLSTVVSFKLGQGILNVRLGLEENFGLKQEDFFFSGYLIHRFTPKSGLSLNYYGLSRSLTRVTDQEYIFLKDTIPAGSLTRAFFTTEVFSLGYLYTLVDNKKTILAAYFNLYFMHVIAGAKSEGLRIDEKADVTAPLPNFGVIGNFRLTPRMQMDAGLGYFALNTANFSGRLSNLFIQFSFHPIRWLGLSIGYEKFELRTNFEEKNVETLVEYDFRGPSLGMKITF